MIKAVSAGAVLGLVMVAFIHPYVTGSSNGNLVITLSMMLAFGVAPLVFVTLLAPNVSKQLVRNGLKRPHVIGLMIGGFGTVGLVHGMFVLGGY